MNITIKQAKDCVNQAAQSVLVAIKRSVVNSVYTRDGTGFMQGVG